MQKSQYYAVECHQKQRFQDVPAKAVLKPSKDLAIQTQNLLKLTQILHKNLKKVNMIMPITHFTENSAKMAGFKGSTCPDIPLIKSVFVQKGDDVKEKTAKLNYPLITKPVCEGSSFGMTKVNTPEELENAYLEAIKYNDDVLIEEYLVGIAATVGVLEGSDGLFATEILELRPKHEWYDYECKYTKGMTEFILPAELSEDMTKQVKEIAVKAFKTAGCKGVSRVDFHIVNNIPYVLEINTSPGMTETSDLPAQANAMGINYDNLVEIILNGAGLNK